MAKREYQRLTPARPRSRFALVSAGNSSLWLGQDHLLCIDSNGYTETYKRFYYRDIQAITLQKTERQKISSLILGFLTGLCLLFFLLYKDVGLRVVLGIIGGLFGVCFLVDVIAGPSSYCVLRTAVQTEELPSMNRMRRARRALNRLRPLIAAAQGELTPEEVKARWNEPAAGPSNAPAGSGGSQNSAEPNAGYIVDDPNAPPRIVS